MRVFHAKTSSQSNVDVTFLPLFLVSNKLELWKITQICVWSRGIEKWSQFCEFLNLSMLFLYIYEIFTYISLPLKKRMWWDRYEQKSFWTMFIIHRSNSTPEGKTRNRKLHPQLIFVYFFFRSQFIRLTKLRMKMVNLCFFQWCPLNINRCTSRRGVIKPSHWLGVLGGVTLAKNDDPFVH